MDNDIIKEISIARKNAELLITGKEIHQAIDRIGENIASILKKEVPVFLCVMKGGLPFTSELLKRIQSPLELDYVHVDRYRNKTHGGSIHWERKPTIDLKDRTVVLLDDIFDEGYTMQELVTFCEIKGANKILSAVLLKKILGKKYVLYEPDFVGLPIKDRYVFGWGMDYKGYWRNLSDVYAISED